MLDRLCLQSLSELRIPRASAGGVCQVNASQRVTLVVFGRKAKKLAEGLGVHPDDLRNALTPDELILLQEVEDTAVRLIDIQDMHPDDAIQQTAERLLIQV